MSCTIIKIDVGQLMKCIIQSFTGCFKVEKIVLKENISQMR
jgi:hypothetical protein